MKATGFEVRHQQLLHRLLVLAAFLTYLIDRDDIVWRFIRSTPGEVRMLERSIFAAVTILFVIAALLCTRSRMRPASEPGRKAAFVGEFLYAVALGSLAPLAGFLILVAGEALRISRLALRDDTARKMPVSLPAALRQESLKWGLCLTLVVFTITLTDRLAEILAGLSVLVWLTLNALRRR
jgi:hypothetical protein